MSVDIDNQINQAVRRYRLDIEGTGFGFSIIVMVIYIAWRTYAVIQQAGGDLNFDGQFTISDTWIGFIGALHEPGNFPATSLGDGFWSFFEIAYWMVPLWITIPISLVFYLLVMGIITTMVEALFVLQYRIRVSFQLRPNIKDHLVPGDIIGFSILGACIVFVIWGVI